MKGSVNVPSSRTEIFSKSALITVFSSDADQNTTQSLQFARQIAALKNIQSYSEPFYVMDMEKVNDLIEEWCCNLPRVQPYYSINCNNDAVLLKLLATNRYIGFNCMNNQNLLNALEFVSTDRILYSNPVWTRPALKQAAAKFVQTLTFESSRDLDRIILNHPTAELLLHICINHQSEDPNALLGCEVESASELLELAASLGATVVGISFNLGSGDVAPALYSTAILASAKLFQLGLAFGFSMSVLNIGCGFSSLDKSFEKTCAFINDSLDYCFPLDDFPQLRIIATPGRFFAGAVFSLVTNIVQRRLVDLSNITNDDFDFGRKAFIYQTNEGYYGGFGCRMNANIEPECVPLFDHYLDNFSAEHVYGSVIGPTFESMDVVQPICHFRPLVIGDWLLWNNMGAYSLNNRGTLDNKDGYVSPMVFYFTSQNQWKSMDILKHNINLVANLPASPTGSDLSSDGNYLMEEDGLSLLSDEAYQFMVDDEQDDNYEQKFLTLFGWPLHE